LKPSPEDARRRERFRELYADNYPLILGYAMRRCVQPEDAADVVAETFLAAWRRLDDVPPEHARTWLYGVARRVLANQLRSRRRRRRLGERLGDELRQFATTPPDVVQAIPASAGSVHLFAEETAPSDGPFPRFRDDLNEGC
jgi:RNA polymerase sigma factor (sigma-70 family)